MGNRSEYGGRNPDASPEFAKAEAEFDSRMLMLEGERSPDDRGADEEIATTLAPQISELFRLHRENPPEKNPEAFSRMSEKYGTRLLEAIQTRRAGEKVHALYSKGLAVMTDFMFLFRENEELREEYNAYIFEEFAEAIASDADGVPERLLSLEEPARHMQQAMAPLYARLGAGKPIGEKTREAATKLVPYLRNVSGAADQIGDSYDFFSNEEIAEWARVYLERGDLDGVDVLNEAGRIDEVKFGKKVRMALHGLIEEQK